MISGYSANFSTGYRVSGRNSGRIKYPTHPYGFELDRFEMSKNLFEHSQNADLILSKFV